MNKKISIIIGILLIIIPFSASALSPLYVAKCFVKGEIVGFKFHEAYDDSEPMLSSPSYPDRFVLNILIYETELSGEWEYDHDTCEEMYPVNKKKEIYIPASEVSENDILIGGIIEGDVNNDFGPNFQKFSLLPGKEEPKLGLEKDKDGSQKNEEYTSDNNGDKEGEESDMGNAAANEEYKKGTEEEQQPEKETKRDIVLVIIFIVIIIFIAVFYKFKK